MADDATPSEGSADPLIGSVLAGRYRIVKKLGGGAMGSVYLGEHLKFGRMDAIKVLHGGMARDQESTDRFLRGARNASAINHPNVCTVYDFGDTDEGIQFLAMEFVDGESLSDILDDQGPLPLRRGIEITRQIGEALDAAHHLGIVHRDLKPGNVMLVEGRDGRDIVKVVDFDIAKGTAEGEGSEVTRTGFVVGTPEYMSPEQLTGDPLDGRSDVYSLALVFIRIVTGRLPARATSTQDLMVERLTQDPLRLTEIAPALLVPEGVQNAVDHALQRRRQDRPPNAAAFVAALVRGARSGPSPATDSPVAAAGSAAPESPGAPGVPETQVGLPPSAGGGPSQPAGSSAKKLAPYLVGGAVAIAAAVFGIQAMSGGDPPPVDPPPTATGEEAAGTAIASSDPPIEDTTSSPSGAGGNPDTTPPANDPEPAPAQPDPTPPPTPSPGEGTSATEGSGDSATVLSAAAAEDLLMRQFDRLNDAPSQRTLDAVADTSTQMWNESQLPDRVRGLAAYLVASSLVETGDEAGALSWARRAVELEPGNRGYRTLLEALGGGR